MPDAAEFLADQQSVTASAPCRIDLGGTLDLSTMHLPLAHLKPCTFNIALDMRTRVTITPGRQRDVVRIASKGVDRAQYRLNDVSFDQRLGLMFAVAAHFNISGIEIEIDSASPPRSALGGSSAAAVALVAALMKVRAEDPDYQPPLRQVAWLAHQIEAGVAGVPCGMQDQLAATYGGVHAWHWHAKKGRSDFERESLAGKNQMAAIEQWILVAYCGIPHESKDINRRWVDQFLGGRHRSGWREITDCARRFVDAVKQQDFAAMMAAMNREVALRLDMTPDVLDDMGYRLMGAAGEKGCAARFTGAGGGGCMWAIGMPPNIRALEEVWRELLLSQEGACLLPTKIARQGLAV